MGVVDICPLPCQLFAVIFTNATIRIFESLNFNILEDTKIRKANENEEELRPVLTHGQITATAEPTRQGQKKILVAVVCRLESERFYEHQLRSWTLNFENLHMNHSDDDYVERSQRTFRADQLIQLAAQNELTRITFDYDSRLIGLDNL